MAEAYESSLWAIAVKGTENVRALQEATKEFAKCDSFRIPGAQLRVGTLDSLMSLSDELTKSDIFADQTVTKMYKQLLDLKPEATPDIVGGASARGALLRVAPLRHCVHKAQPAAGFAPGASTPGGPRA